MANREFSTLLPRIAPSVPGCPYPLVEQHIRDCAIRTCERTLAWRHAEAPYVLEPGVFQYKYRKPTNSVVHAIFLASLNKYPLDHLTLDRAVELYPHWADLYGGVDFETLWGDPGAINTTSYNEDELNGGATFTLTEDALKNASEPRAITQLTPDEFVLLPAPDDDKPYELRLIYALKPKRSATSLPEHIFDELEDAIVHGTLQELLILPEVNWGDRELASYHARQYRFHTSERRARANLGNARGSMAVKFQPF